MLDTGQTALSRSVPARRRHAPLDRAAYQLISRTAAHIGEDYFRSLVEEIVEVVGSSGAFIVERPLRAQHEANVLAIAPVGTASLARRFPIENSCVRECLDGASSIHVKSARLAFPADPVLEHLRADSCLVIALRAASGAPNGFLGVADTGQLHDTLAIEAILRLVAPRAGAEIERLQLNAELLAQSERNRAFMDRARDLILLTRPGPEPVIDYVNPAFEEFTGYAVADLYADPQLLLRIAHPDYREDFARMLLGRDTSQPTVWRWIRRDGSTLWTEGSRTTITDGDGTVIAFETIARDITAIKEADEGVAAQRQRTDVLEGKATRQILRNNPHSLTFREFTVLGLVADGLTDKQIAVRLDISLNTVGKHVSNILAKMGVSSRTEASVHAVQQHLLD